MNKKNGYLANSCDLLNRADLSRSQGRELQRFIDENAHIVQFRERNTETKQEKIKRPSRYASLRNSRNSGAEAYSTPTLLHASRSRSAGFSNGSANPTEAHSSPSQTALRSSPLESAPRRKGVKWSDSVADGNQRARSLSPYPAETRVNRPSMHYGSTGHLNDRWTDQPHSVQDRTASPAYSSLDRHRDDYNRYETQRHLQTKDMQQRRLEEDASRFSGYGDRPGSGVEFMPTRWHGGEILFDKRQLPQSLKPRRIYYSPIGDGVVAADGVEMKRAPKDMSPRISVTHTRTVDKGAPGRDGYNVYERSLTHGAGSDYGSDYGGTSGRNSRTAGTLSPSNDPYGSAGGAGAMYGPGYGAHAKTPTYEAREPREPRDYTAMRTPTGGRDFGNEPLGDVYPGQGGPSGGAGYGGGGGYDGGYAPGGRAIRCGRGGNQGYGTPTSTLGASSAGDLFGSAPTSNYTTLACRDPSGTLHMAQCNSYASDLRVRSRSNDDLNEGFDSYGGYSTLGDGRSSAASGQYGYRMESPRRLDINADYLITNPRELIHQYATTTPVAVLDINDSQMRSSASRTYSSTAQERYTPYPPYKGSEASIHPSNFVRQLRDENLTSSQRDANRRLDPVNMKESNYEHKISEIRSRTSRGPAINEIDALTEKMMHGLQTGHPTPPRL